MVPMHRYIHQSIALHIGDLVNLVFKITHELLDIFHFQGYDSTATVLQYQESGLSHECFVPLTN